MYDSGICCICLDLLGTCDTTPQATTVLHCGHVYHKACILEWQQRSNLCPICRSPSKSAIPQPYMIKFAHARQWLIMFCATHVWSHLLMFWNPHNIHTHAGMLVFHLWGYIGAHMVVKWMLLHYACMLTVFIVHSMWHIAGNAAFHINAGVIVVLCALDVLAVTKVIFLTRHVHRFHHDLHQILLR